MIDTEFASLTELGRRFGVSSRECGGWLADLGLRVVGGDPTEKAHSGGLTKSVPTGHGERVYWIWSLQKSVAPLKQAGRKEVQPEEQPAVSNHNLLVGSFSYRPSGNSWELLNGDGRVFSWAAGGEAVPKYMVQLLNLAHKHGRLPPQTQERAGHGRAPALDCTTK